MHVINKDPVVHVRVQWIMETPKTNKQTNNNNKNSLHKKYQTIISISLQRVEVGHSVEEGEDFVIPVHGNFDSPSSCCSAWLTATARAINSFCTLICTCVEMFQCHYVQTGLSACIILWWMLRIRSDFCLSFFQNKLIFVFTFHFSSTYYWLQHTITNWLFSLVFLIYIFFSCFFSLIIPSSCIALVCDNRHRSGLLFLFFRMMNGTVSLWSGTRTWLPAHGSFSSSTLSTQRQLRWWACSFFVFFSLCHGFCIVVVL